MADLDQLYKAANHESHLAGLQAVYNQGVADTLAAASVDVEPVSAPLATDLEAQSVAANTTLVDEVVAADVSPAAGAQQDIQPVGTPA